MVFRATIGQGVFIAARAVVNGVDVPANTSVPSATLSSQDQIDQLGQTDPAQHEFMETVVQTNIKLAEGYLDRM